MLWWNVSCLHCDCELEIMEKCRLYQCHSQHASPRSINFKSFVKMQPWFFLSVSSICNLSRFRHVDVFTFRQRFTNWTEFRKSIMYIHKYAPNPSLVTWGYEGAHGDQGWQTCDMLYCVFPSNYLMCHVGANIFILWGKGSQSGKRFLEILDNR